jgi:two-component system CheB/CheR fusion protein
VVEVKDTGEGISPDLMPRIFNAFEQGGRDTTRQFGGLGLGLAISRGLVELHGGSIAAHSDGKGKGTTFWVTLPLEESTGADAASQVGGPRSLLPAAATDSLRILLVEDHEDTSRVMRRILMADGHTVWTANCVAAALETASRESVDLLVSDLGLPDGSGVDVIRTLRQRGSTAPAIALSGYGQEEDIRRSCAAGFNVHLTKPVDIQRLKQAIRQLASSAQGPIGTSPLNQDVAP